MRMAQDRNFVVIAIISAFVAATGWWGPAGRSEPRRLATTPERKREDE